MRARVARSTEQVVARGSNVFGVWVIKHWPPIPPEANFHSFVIHWRTPDDHGYSIHPTLAAAKAANPLTNEETPTCPMMRTKDTSNAS